MRSSATMAHRMCSTDMVTCACGSPVALSLGLSGEMLSYAQAVSRGRWAAAEVLGWVPKDGVLLILLAVAAVPHPPTVWELVQMSVPVGSSERTRHWLKLRRLGVVVPAGPSLVAGSRNTPTYTLSVEGLAAVAAFHAKYREVIGRDFGAERKAARFVRTKKSKAKAAALRS